MLSEPKSDLMEILLLGDARLRETCAPIENIDARVAKLAGDMLATMYDAPGIGLAGPQVGAMERLFVMDVSHDEKAREPHVMINPVIHSFSEEKSVYKEGCLSIPGIYADVKRPAEIEVSYHDLDGNEQRIGAGGLLSTCIQHELDHLDGVCFIDHLSSLKRGMVMRKFNKMKRSGKFDE